MMPSISPSSTWISTHSTSKSASPEVEKKLLLVTRLDLAPSGVPREGKELGGDVAISTVTVSALIVPEIGESNLQRDLSQGDKNRS